MKHMLMVASGKIPIPPPGWGAVETVIWHTKLALEARGWTVDILNVNRKQVPLRLLGDWLRGKRYDWVYCHNEMACPGIARLEKLLGFRQVALSHSGFEDPATIPTSKWFRKLSRCRQHVVLTTELAQHLRHDSRNRVTMIPNGVDCDAFHSEDIVSSKAIYLGQIGARKRQGIVSRLLLEAGVPCDFVGPIDPKAGPESALAEGASHLGSWSRSEVTTRLGGYAALVLYSESEAQPLVCLEALAAGLSVVGSPAALRGLDVSLPFIHEVQRDQDLAEAVRGAVAAHAQHRVAAREYARANFDWSVVAARLEGFLLS